MIKLIWTIATLTAQGPVIGDLPEQTEFKTEQECRAFGEATSPRVQDWVRGAVRVGWDHPVGVKYRCEGGRQT